MLVVVENLFVLESLCRSDHPVVQGYRAPGRCNKWGIFIFFFVAFWLWWWLVELLWWKWYGCGGSSGGMVVVVVVFLVGFWLWSGELV